MTAAEIGNTLLFAALAAWLICMIAATTICLWHDFTVDRREVPTPHSEPSGDRSGVGRGGNFGPVEPTANPSATPPSNAA